MRQLYEYVHVDTEMLRFCIRCPVCGRKYYGVKIPMICRSVRTFSKCESGKGERWSQTSFNRAKAESVRQLAMEHFNQCRRCFRWVCNECYDISNSSGSCRECSQKE